MDIDMPKFEFKGPGIGTSLDYRFHAAQMREKMQPFFDSQEKIICDFSGIETISESYADECFGKLLEHSVGQPHAYIKFENASAFITGTISAAIRKRLSNKAV